MNTKKIAVSFLNDMCNKDYSGARKHMAELVECKVKEKMTDCVPKK